MPNFRHRLAAIGVATLFSLPAALASAAPPVIEHWHDAGTRPFTFCAGLDIQETFDYSGSLRIVPRGKSGIPYFTETYRGSTVWTNLATGRSLRVEQAGVDKDAKIVDNGNGTLSIIVMGTGTVRYYDTSGRLLFSNNGQLRYEILVDNNGTPTDYTDDGEGVFVGIVKPSTGTNGTQDRNFCADLAQYTG